MRFENANRMKHWIIFVWVFGDWSSDDVFYPFNGILLFLLGFTLKFKDWEMGIASPHDLSSSSSLSERAQLDSLNCTVSCVEAGETLAFYFSSSMSSSKESQGALKVLPPSHASWDKFPLCTSLNSNFHS